MSYDNILRAIYGTPQGSEKLTYDEMTDNYRIFNELQMKGVKLQDLIDKANAPKEPALDEGLFSAMEEAVKGSQEVKDAKTAQERAMRKVIMRLCSSDPEYQSATKAYRDIVVKTYTGKRSESVDEDPKNGKKDKASVKSGDD